MKVDAGSLLLSATDLSAFSACRHATLLDREAAHGRLAKPYRNDPSLELLQERGRIHEDWFKTKLEEKHQKPVFRVPGAIPKTEAEWSAGTARTLAAMRAGHAVIYQAPLAGGGWTGVADFLVRVDHQPGVAASALGDYHYEAVDTKLAVETRATAVLQLCVYTELLTGLQNLEPKWMTLVSPPKRGESHAGGELPGTRLPTASYFAYFRLIRGRMAKFVVDAQLDEVYPEPCEQCDVCAWWSRCDDRRRTDDHLSLVAGIGLGHRKLLVGSGVATLTALGRLQLPMADRPRKLGADSLERLQHQARLQLEAMETGTPRYELLPPDQDRGLSKLPVPSPGDIFFDIEADRYALDGTFHYLLGWVEIDAARCPQFRALWAENRAEERKNFEQFVDLVVARRRTHESMHIYHFAPFERTALAEMMGRYASREDEVDDLLRNQVLCDLLPVVKQSLRAGLESYSLKLLEQFYAFTRSTDLREAAQARRLFELHREGGWQERPTELLKTIEDYNREDCESTFFLRAWLEDQRSVLEAQGHVLGRPELVNESPSEDLSQWSTTLKQLRERLLTGLPVDLESQSAGERARQLTADLLDWHRRKNNPDWREYFRIRRLVPEDLIDESGPIGNVSGGQDVGPEAKSRLYEYSFPAQEFKIKVGDAVECPVTQQPLGTVHELDRAAGKLVVKSTSTPESPALGIALVPRMLNIEGHRESLSEIADSLARTRFGLPAVEDEWGPAEVLYPLARALLLREPPQLAKGVPLQRPDEAASAAAVRIATSLRTTVLPIQGPPGSGKSHTAARMILALLNAGKRVGITASGHKVISNLLEKVHDAAAESRTRIKSAQKISKPNELFVHDDNSAFKKLKDANANLIAGTSWLWVSKDMRNSVDVLFVDEAGQFSLADALAITMATDSLVLLGDPQQLANPDQGSHPPGAGVSVLEHILQERETIREGHGLFLEQTWRLPPTVARFTSDYFYSSRLKVHPGCEQRALRPGKAADRFAGSGLFFEPVAHEGNINECLAEAQFIAQEVHNLLVERSTWIGRNGAERLLEPEHILIVAPYNAQVVLLGETILPSCPGVQIGTVDKFQGQEAPVVFYSLTTSDPKDAPRGLDFLFSLNRLNVATSRTEAIVVVVGSPRLLETECKTPKQMRLVNGLCGAVERATAGN